MAEKIDAETESIKKEWTIMVYMAGDNNLSEDLITSLKDLKDFAGHPDVNIVVFYDSNYPPKRISIYDFSVKPPTNDLEAIEIPNGVFQVLNRPVPPNISDDSFDPKIEFVPLIKFVPWVLKQYKFRAKKYALILSGHSDGILGKTILRDDNPPNSVTLKKLGEILETCRKALKKYSNNEKFDLLGFDSCLMGMMESAYEIKTSAKYMVASEGNIPNSGWNYAAVLKKLLDDKGKTEPKDLAVSIVENFACYNYDFIAGGRSINISAYDLEKTDLFAYRLNALAGILLKILNLKIDKKNTEQAVLNGLLKQKFIDYILQSHYYSQTFMHDQAVDVLDFEESLLNNILKDSLLFGFLLEKANSESADPDNSAKKENQFSLPKVLLEAIKEYSELPSDHRQFIIKNCFVGADYQFSKGVSAFFPWSQMPMKMIFAEYKELKFTKERKNWKKFIKKYIELTNRTPDTKYLFSLTDNQDMLGGLQLMSGDSRKGLDIEILIRILLVLNANEDAGRQYIGRQYIGRQYIGRGDAFYDYFSQLRNYPPFKLDCRVKPPKEIGITNCCDKYDQNNSFGCDSVEKDDNSKNK